MQDILTALTVGTALLYLVKVFALPSMKHARAPDVPLKNLLRNSPARASRARAKRHSVSP